ncbi:hypothetical protein BJ138DRAFT_1120703 [Hygrophoropsis aurantiaca]|uniref:Uncharacterized protein n=1 Tax=Hygrophoropsis aurantiaca TaxID=72124 RepID=A0ACB7ZQZ9_9AGAM|nr:hypothetical protein BJ138DRAFT_1120703 [Hygrophoropsis aurantiaca]
MYPDHSDSQLFSQNPGDHNGNQTRGGLDSSGQLWTESQSPQKGFYISSSVQTGLRLSTSVQIGYRLSQHHRDITKHYILLTIVLED